MAHGTRLMPHEIQYPCRTLVACMGSTVGDVRASQRKSHTNMFILSAQTVPSNSVPQGVVTTLVGRGCRLARYTSRPPVVSPIAIASANSSACFLRWRSTSVPRVVAHVEGSVCCVDIQLHHLLFRLASLVKSRPPSPHRRSWRMFVVILFARSAHRSSHVFFID